MNLTVVGAPIIERFGEETALKMIKEAGFDGVDFSFDIEENFDRLDENYKEYALKTKALLQKYNLTCYQAHAPFNFSFGDEMSEKGEKYLGVIRAIEYAAVLGAEVIVIHAVKVPYGEDFLTYNLNYYKSFIPYAQRFGIKIAVENLLNSIFWTPNKLSQFIGLLDSSVFCACVDVGHAAITGMPPENYISGMPKGLIKCVHLHDTDYQADRHWVPFSGLQNWDNIMKALAEYGFCGDVEMEIIHSYDNLDDELIMPMLVYSEKVGRLLVKKFNQNK